MYLLFQILEADIYVVQDEVAYSQDKIDDYPFEHLRVPSTTNSPEVEMYAPEQNDASFDIPSTSSTTTTTFQTTTMVQPLTTKISSTSVRPSIKTGISTVKFKRMVPIFLYFLPC